MRIRHGYTLCVLSASAAVQLISLAFVGNSVSGGDARTYIALSHDWMSLQRLLSPGAFEGNFWPAGYPGFLAGFSGFGDSQLLAVRIAQVLMVLAIAWMSSEIAGTVSARARRWTLLIVAFSPTLIWGIWAIGYELLLGLLVTLSIWFAWKGARSRWMFAGSGLAFGLSLIVQFRAVTIVPVLFYLAWKSKRSVAWSIGASLPLLLWSIRSLIATGNLAPWSTNGGYNLWDGNSPQATGHNVFPLPLIPHGEASQASAALHWMISHPAQVMELMARKSLYLFYPTQISDISDRLPAASLVSVVQWLYSLAVVLILALFLGALVWRVDIPAAKLAPLFWLSVLFLLPNLIFIVEARFRIPVEAMLLTVVTATVVDIFERRQHSLSRS